MNHYITRYNKIIQHFSNNPPGDVFCERHHIVPLCLGGVDTKENIIVLPARVHIICHYLLHKAHPENSSLSHAFAMMAVNNAHQSRVFSSRLYEASKLARSKALKGKPRPEWVKQKLRKPKHDKSNYFGNTNAKGNRGKKYKPRSQDHINNIRAAMMPHYEARKKKTAETIAYYRKEFSNSNMTRKEFAKLHNLSLSCIKKYLKAM